MAENETDLGESRAAFNRQSGELAELADDHENGDTTHVADQHRP